MVEEVFPDVKMDFFADFASFYKQQLVAARYPVDSTDTAEELVLKYLNAFHRRIPLKPRRVRVSRELQCPPQHQPGLDLFLNKVGSGQDLGPHQSRQFPKAADYNDGLFNDWGIHHFHLGTSFRADGLVESTGNLLFARVTEDDFYCIVIDGHGNWSKQDLLEIIHRNWPQSIEGAQLKSPPGSQVIGLSNTYTDAEIAQLRKAGVNVMTQRADGTIHALVGGGLAGDQTSLTVARQRNSLVRLCRTLEKLTRRSLAEFLEKAKQEGVEMRSPICFRLEISSGKTSAVEVNSKARIELAIPLQVAPLV